MSGMHKDLVSRLISASLPSSTHKLSSKDREMAIFYIKEKNHHRDIEKLKILSDADLYHAFALELNEDFMESDSDWINTGKV